MTPNKMKGGCKCVSSNRPEPWQTDGLVKMQPPIEFFYNQPTGEEKQPLKPVFIDFCISHVIEHLWKHGISTKNSCCGHNGLFGEKRPSIVFEDNLSPDKAEEIREIIKKVDDREFDIYSWVFTKL